MTTLACCFPCIVLLTLLCVVHKLQLLLHAVFVIWYYTRVWIMVCLICCLCNVYGGIVVFVIWVCIALVEAGDNVVFLGVYVFLLYLLWFFIWIHDWRWGYLIFYPWKFRDMFFREVGWVGSAYLFGSWIVSSIFFLFTKLLWVESTPLERVILGVFFANAFVRYVSALIDMCLELK